ncbi:pentapeptide repeat-containing protein [Burkholderia ubonensis]|uniref:pentapeptide repeat-containing protein n=1 Tax=Burkholderia ubonensis TaxID=101571 RepID=UPI00358EE818
MREHTELALSAPVDHATFDADFTADETWAWEQIRQAQPANFKKHAEASGSASMSANCPPVGVLSARFLRQILTEEPRRSILARHGLHIVGARFSDELCLPDLVVSYRMIFEDCNFEGPLFLDGLRSDRRVAFEGCTFKGNVSFLEARINGELSLQGSRFMAELDGFGIRTENDLVMIDSEAAGVNFREARIGGQVHADSARFRDLDLQGVRVASDLFVRESHLQTLDLQDANIGGQFDADDTRIRKSLALAGAKIGSDMFFNNAHVTSIDLTDAVIGGRLLMRKTLCKKLTMIQTSIASSFVAHDRTRIGTMNLNGAKVRGDTSLNDIRVRGPMSLHRFQCDGTLSMKKAQIYGPVNLHSGRILGDLILKQTRCARDFELRRASISGQANFAGSCLDGWLDMECIEVGTYIFLREANDDGTPRVDEDARGRYSAVSLVDAKVHGTVYTRKSTFNGEMKLNGLDTEYLWLRESVFNECVNFRSGTVRHDLELGGSRFERDVDFRGSVVLGCLALGSDEISGPTWDRCAKLFLSDASTMRLTDREPTGKDIDEAWPRMLSLNGFKYARLGGYEESRVKQDRMSGRSKKWFCNWLEKDEVFSKDAYRHLAEILGKQSEPETADSIRFAARERDRENARRWTPRWFALTTLKWTIGYGIGFRYLYSLPWVVLLSLLGFAVFWKTAALPLSNPGSVWLFSLDQLLPVVKIYANSDDLAKKCHGLAMAYLAIHRSMGFILSSFVVAGLSGLTQK